MQPSQQTVYHEVHLRDYLYVLRKRKKAVISFFVLVVALGMLSTLFEKVLYRASASILIEHENPNVVNFKEVMALDSASTEFYQTQYQKIKSRSLIRELIEKDKLTEDPYLKSLMKGKLRPFLRGLSFLPKWFQEFLTDPYAEDILIKRMLRIRPVRSTRLVEVSVLYPDPFRSADLTNSLAKLFIERNLQDRLMVSQQATQLIAEQLFELKSEVAKAERALQQYKEDQGLLNIPSIREKDIFLQEAKLELVKLQSEKSKLSKRYLPAHPKLIHLHSQIDGLEEKIREEEKKIMGMGRAAIDYAELERAAESSRQIYEALLKRLQETTSEAQSQASNVTILDSAQPPLKPFTPRPFLNLIIAVFVGLLGGSFLAFFLEYFDSTVKIPDDIVHGLGVSLLGIIPFADRLHRGGPKGDIFFSPREPTPASEALRALRTALIFQLRHIPGCRVILFTSPNPDEGKTTIVYNLAAAFEQNHLKVLLIDADLRKPNLHKILELPVEKGMTEVLEGTLKLEKCIHRNVVGFGYDFLSCGTPSHHPTEILGSKKMGEVMDALRQSYDIILIDSSPYLAVADVIVLSEYVDAVVVMAKYQKTEKRHLRDLPERFIKEGNKLCGVVINQVSVREKDYYYQQYYYYGYGDVRPKK